VVYFGVNWDIVWGAVQDSLPPFKEKIERILEVIEESKNNGGY
jgi:uncharacterized protein with HEPN domain